MVHVLREHGSAARDARPNAHGQSVVNNNACEHGETAGRMSRTKGGDAQRLV